MATNLNFRKKKKNNCSNYYNQSIKKGGETCDLFQTRVFNK